MIMQILKLKKNFFCFFFCITIFQEEAQNKTRSGSRRPFINDVNT